LIFCFVIKNYIALSHNGTKIFDCQYDIQKKQKQKHLLNFYNVIFKNKYTIKNLKLEKQIICTLRNFLKHSNERKGFININCNNKIQHI